MRVVHSSDSDGEETLATRVEVADSFLSRARGLMFRRSIPENFALVFPFDRVDRRSIHMAFVRFPIDVVWVCDDRVERTERLAPWTGVAWARADTIVELPAGAADAVTAGDTVRIES